MPRRKLKANGNEWKLLGLVVGCWLVAADFLVGDVFSDGCVGEVLLYVDVVFGGRRYWCVLKSGIRGLCGHLRPLESPRIHEHFEPRSFDRFFWTQKKRWPNNKGCAFLESSQRWTWGFQVTTSWTPQLDPRQNTNKKRQPRCLSKWTWTTNGAKSFTQLNLISTSGSLRWWIYSPAAFFWWVPFASWFP